MNHLGKKFSRIEVLNYSKINKIIDRKTITGKNLNVEIEIQDNQKTLKIFISKEGVNNDNN